MWPLCLPTAPRPRIVPGPLAAHRLIGNASRCVCWWCLGSRHINPNMFWLGTFPVVDCCVVCVVIGDAPITPGIGVVAILGVRVPVPAPPAPWVKGQGGRRRVVLMPGSAVALVPVLGQRADLLRASLPGPGVAAGMLALPRCPGGRARPAALQRALGGRVGGLSANRLMALGPAVREALQAGPMGAMPAGQYPAEACVALCGRGWRFPASPVPTRATVICCGLHAYAGRRLCACPVHGTMSVGAAAHA